MLHRLAPRRLLVEHRDVHVAVLRQRQRARDRRRRHHQNVDRPAPWRQAPSAAPRRSGAVRRRWPAAGRRSRRPSGTPHGCRRGSGCRPRASAASFAARSAPLSRPVRISTGRPPPRPAARARPGAGGRGSRSAPSSPPARPPRPRPAPKERHQRLARAHIALQQPVHPVRRRHVGGDLAPSPAPARRSGGRAAPRAPWPTAGPSLPTTAPCRVRRVARASASVSWCAKNSS